MSWDCCEADLGLLREAYMLLSVELSVQPNPSHKKSAFKTMSILMD